MNAASAGRERPVKGGHRADPYWRARCPTLLKKNWTGSTGSSGYNGLRPKGRLAESNNNPVNPVNPV